MTGIAVVIAGLAAAGVLALFWRRRLPLWGYGLALIPAAMLSHALARIGAPPAFKASWIAEAASGLRVGSMSAAFSGPTTRSGVGALAGMSPS